MPTRLGAMIGGTARTGTGGTLLVARGLTDRLQWRTRSSGPWSDGVKAPVEPINDGRGGRATAVDYGTKIVIIRGR